MAKKRSRVSAPVRISAEVKLHPTTPIPREARGDGYTYGAGARYLPFLDGDDTFFTKIIEARLLSPTQSACVSTKTDYCIGEGVVVTNLEEDQQEDPAFTDWRTNCNAEGANLNAVVRSALESFNMCGNSPIELVRVKVAGKAFFYVYAHDVQDCRLGKEVGESAPSFALISASFRGNGLFSDISKAKKIPLYRAGQRDSDNWAKDAGVERTMLWIKNEMSGYKHYGMHPSVSSLTWQVVEYQDVRYNLDQLENNMVVGGTLVLQGSHTDVEATKIARKITSQHTGSGRRGRTAVIASEQPITDSKFIEHNTQKEGSYKELATKAQSNILLTNNWDAVLAGLQSAAAMGKGGNYLEEVYKQKLKTVIGPIQKKFVESLLDPIVAMASAWMGTTWSEYILAIKPVELAGAPELAFSAEGVRLMLEIAKAVREGDYTYDAAVALVADRFKVSPAKAALLLGDITVKTGNNVPA